MFYKFISRGLSRGAYSTSANPALHAGQQRRIVLNPCVSGLQPFAMVATMSRITIVGAGLAGCEAAWQAAERGISVTLYEMKPHRYSPAHQ